MTHKLLTILAALALVLSAPLAAQLPDENPAAPDATVEDVDRELDGDTEVEFNDGSEVELEADRDSASVQIEDDDALIDADAEFDTDERELPRTATPLPLLALLGAGSLISALGLRITRRK